MIEACALVQISRLPHFGPRADTLITEQLAKAGSHLF